MTKKPRVLLDVDGVIADFIGGVIKTARLLYPDVDVRREQATHWDFWAGLGLAGERKKAIARQIAEGDRWCERLDPYEPALAGVPRLLEIADVYFVTSPWASRLSWDGERRAWLERHFGVRHDRVISTSAKHLVVGDCLIDDKTSTLVEWQGTDHCRGFAVQWVNEHNGSDEWNGLRAKDWDRVVELVRGWS